MDSLQKVKTLNREPVLLLHGIFGASDGFILNGPDLSPAFIVANSGKYDLWFMNVRGNTYSRQHQFLEPDADVEFWDYSFEEIGSLDLVTSIDYILEATNKKQLSILAFS